MLRLLILCLALVLGGHIIQTMDGVISTMKEVGIAVGTKKDSHLGYVLGGFFFVLVNIELEKRTIILF
jgi:hypothetical protein